MSSKKETTLTTEDRRKSSERFREPELAINRVYTRHGDQGLTRLVGGQKISKADLRIESYGTVDEPQCLHWCSASILFRP